MSSLGFDVVQSSTMFCLLLMISNGCSSETPMVPKYATLAIERYGEPKLIVVQELQPYIDQLSESDTESLTNTYLRIAQSPDDARAIYRVATDPTATLRSRAWSFILIIEELGRRKVPPFNDGRVRFRPDAHVPDWTSTPPAVQRWAELADRFGVLGDADMLAAADQATDEEAQNYRQLLREWNDNWPAIEAWMQKNPITSNECAWRVYRLSSFLDQFSD